jgi:hypothetical protein
LTGTTVADGVAALVAVFDAVKPAGWQVLDGGTYGVDVVPQFLYVAFSRDPSAPDVEVTPTPANASLTSMWETYTVHCELSTWADADDVPGQRRAAVAAYNAFVPALAANPTLGDVVATAYPGPFDVTSAPSGEGTLATVRFTVQISACK